MAAASTSLAPSGSWLCTQCSSTNDAAAEYCVNRRCRTSRSCGELAAEESLWPAEPPVERRQRCGVCEGCLAANCGVCTCCVDMPLFGGKGAKRQPCERRACAALLAQAEARAASRAAREEAHASSLAARGEVERACRDTDRAAKAARREEERQLEQAARAAARLAKAAMRAPTPRGEGEGQSGSRRGAAPKLPTDPSAYGWGVESEHLCDGASVEVLAVDDGFRGAAFRATVLSMQPDVSGSAAKRRKAANKIQIRYDELLEAEGSDAKLTELCPKQQIRLHPPPAPPGFHGLLRVGDPLQLHLDDAWWDVTLTAIEAKAEVLFKVSSVQYEATHLVQHDKLRPCWMWSAANQSWRYLIIAGCGCVPFGEPTQHSFCFADGLPRQHNKFFEMAAELLGRGQL
ncbi:hypothetical protein AB1Y20_022459 [Prymnesium parvum]|uniref:CXXC-type domain-containing protein n=1 Tax=Prymnesium parvum TaxID=97485 RepID=A0AB34JIW8_PRYPA